MLNHCWSIFIIANLKFLSHNCDISASVDKFLPCKLRFSWFLLCWVIVLDCVLDVLSILFGDSESCFNSMGNVNTCCFTRPFGWLDSGHELHSAPVHCASCCSPRSIFKTFVMLLNWVVDKPSIGQAGTWAGISSPSLSVLLRTDLGVYRVRRAQEFVNYSVRSLSWTFLSTCSVLWALTLLPSGRKEQLCCFHRYLLLVPMLMSSPRSGRTERWRSAVRVCCTLLHTMDLSRERCPLPLGPPKACLIKDFSFDFLWQRCSLLGFLLA